MIIRTSRASLKMSVGVHTVLMIPFFLRHKTLRSVSSVESRLRRWKLDSLMTDWRYFRILHRDNFGRAIDKAIRTVTRYYRTQTRLVLELTQPLEHNDDRYTTMTKWALNWPVEILVTCSFSSTLIRSPRCRQGRYAIESTKKREHWEYEKRSRGKHTLSSIRDDPGCCSKSEQAGLYYIEEVRKVRPEKNGQRLDTEMLDTVRPTGPTWKEIK